MPDRELVAQLIKLLRVEGNMSARELMRCLRDQQVETTKRQINHVLYQTAHTFSRDEGSPPRWRLIEPRSETSSESMTVSATVDDVLNLLQEF